MAIFKTKYRIGLTDLTNFNQMSNKAVIKMLENAGGEHSEVVGFGLNEIELTKLSWILLNWKIKIIKRVIYNEEVEIITWARGINKVFTYRDYEIRDKQGNLLVIATSKWTLIDINTGKLARIPQEAIDGYKEENKCVFETGEIAKLQDPEKYDSEITSRITRNYIDINRHVHNLYYLDLAYEALPEEIYKESEFNNIEILYKRQILFNDTIKSLYTKEDNGVIITLKSEDEKILHSIIKLY